MNNTIIRVTQNAKLDGPLYAEFILTLMIANPTLVLQIFAGMVRIRCRVRRLLAMLSRLPLNESSQAKT